MRLELPFDVIDRTVGPIRRHGGTPPLAANHAAQTQAAHQPLDRAARHRDLFAPQRLPDLAHAVDRVVLLPHALDRRRQHRVGFGACRAAFGVGLPGRVQVIRGGFNPEVQRLMESMH